VSVKVGVIVGVGGMSVLVKVGSGVRVGRGVETCATGVLVTQASVVAARMPITNIGRCEREWVIALKGKRLRIMDDLHKARRVN